LIVRHAYNRERMHRMKKNNCGFEWLVIVFLLLFPLLSHAAETQPTEEPVAVVSGDAAAGPEGEAISGDAAAGPGGETVPEDAVEGPEDESMQEEGGIVDPLEPWNRLMFTFNDRLYFWVMKPVAKVYSAVIPEWGRIRVRNVVHNVATPIRFVNCILQLKLHAAVAELGRFVANTVGGLGGMFEVVKDNPQIGTMDRDFGQTLGKYGISNGFYIIWPALGPSSFRDSVGLAGDYFLTPENYITPFLDSFGVQAYEKVNDVSLKIGDYEDFKESAIDPYIAMKDAYYQYRKSKVKEESYSGPLFKEKDRP
jgi:phospholipid-binding lipoprotein MlaA